MLSEDIFHQRGIALLYRTSNVIIQSGIYGKFRFLISMLYSRLQVLRDLCVTYPHFNIYNDVNYLIPFQTNQSNQSDQYIAEGLALAEPENLVRRNSLHVSPSTGYLAVSIADLIILIKTWYLVLDLSKSASATSPTNDLLLIFNALAPVNVGG